MRIQVMTYNIAGCRDYSTGGTGAVAINPAGVLRAVRAVNPAILGMNEVDEGLPRSGMLRTTAYFGKLLGTESRFSCAYRFDGGEYGNALFSTYPILSHETVEIPTINPKSEPRAILHDTLSVGGKTIHVCVLHMGLSKPERESAIRTLRELLASVRDPVIVMGDFYLTPDDETLLPLREILHNTGDALPAGSVSYPGQDHLPEEKRVIDYIFVSKQFTTCSVEIPRIGCSDHSPYTAVLELAD